MKTLCGAQFNRSLLLSFGDCANVFALRRWMFGLVALLSLLLAGLPAQAANYTFPDKNNSLPAGCTVVKNSNNTSFTCGALTLGATDTVTIASPVTITFNGAFTTGNGTLINAGGSASDLRIVSIGAITLGANTQLIANVNGIAAITLGIGSTVGGYLAATSTTGVVTLGANSTVGSYLSTDAGAVTIGDGSTVGGAITTIDGVVTLTTNINVAGSISTVAGGISIGAGSTICGDVITTGAGVIVLTTNIKVGGNVSSTAGAITIGSGSTVGGNIVVSGGGVVTLTGVLVGGNVSTTAGAINLTTSRVGGSVAASGAGVVTLTSSVINDKTLSIPATCATLTAAEYRFDEGAAGTVLDSSGSSLSGTLNGGVTVGGTGKVCTGYNFNGSNAFVAVPNNAQLNPTKITVMAWVRHNAAAIKSWEAIVAKGDSAYRLHLNGGCSINNNNTPGGISFAINGGCAGADLNSGIVPVAGTWYHVVGTYDGATIKLYINGALSASSAYAGTIASNTFPLYIGENAQQTGRFFSGSIDEVKIFGNPLTASQIATGYANENAGKNWDGTARICLISAPHHLEIQHSNGTGLTCAASTLTIKACSDAACTTPYTGGVSGTLSATGAGMTVNWNGSTGGAAGAGFVIASGSNNVTKNVQVVTAGSVVLGTASPTPVPTNATSCNFGSPSCTFTANTAGLIYSNSSTGNTYTIPSQVSGIAATGLYLRAVQASTTNPAVCTPAIISSTTSVTMGYVCNNPVTCQSGSLATINTTAIAPGGTAVSLTFDANGSAPISARYDDVGQITLNASTTITPAGGTAVTLTGSSNAFVVAPHHYGISGVTAAPIKAGSNFAAIVTAYNGLGTPTATRNFGKETAPEGVTLNFSKCQPTGTGTSSGSFSGSLGGFNLGLSSTSNLNWSEVGNGDLTASLTSGSYLSSGLSASGNTGTSGTACNGAGNVGRFIPDHFDTAIVQATAPIPCPAAPLTCPANTTGVRGLLYSNQPFTLQVTAKNAAGTVATTVNYQGVFAKANTFSAWSAAGGTVAGGATQNPGGGSLANTTLAATTFVSGVGTTPVSMPNTTQPTYALGTTTTAPTDIYFRALDADGVTSLRTSAVEAGLKVASGRIRVLNIYGSERLALPIVATVQYYNGTNWMTSLTDSVTSFDSHLTTATPTAGNVLLTPRSGAGTPAGSTLVSALAIVNPASAAVAAGVRNFSLAAPMVLGSANVFINSPAYLPSTIGLATFGIYKSPLIYRRENY